MIPTLVEGMSIERVGGNRMTEANRRVVESSHVERRGRPSVVALALVGVLAVVVGGCGNLTSGGVGEVEVVVGADSVSLAAIGQSVQASAIVPFGVQAPEDSDRIEGTLNVRIQVFLLRAPGQWIELTQGIQALILPIQDPAPIAIARMDVPSGPYQAVRTVFRSVVANVERGLEVDGELITGQILVDLSGRDRLQVETPLEIDVVEETLSTLVVDLHTARWLRRLDRVRREVAHQDFEAHLDLRHIRSDKRP